MATRKPDPVDIEVGQRIKIQRLAAGLSQTELGENIGVTFQQVQKYEKGANRVGAGRLTQVARVLGVSVSAFFDTERSGRAPAARGLESEYLAAPGAFQLVRAYARISPGVVRRAVIAL